MLLLCRYKQLNCAWGCQECRYTCTSEFIYIFLISRIRRITFCFIDFVKFSVVLLFLLKILPSIISFYRLQYIYIFINFILDVIQSDPLSFCPGACSDRR
jgi:hypothetical protein